MLFKVVKNHLGTNKKIPKPPFRVYWAARSEERLETAKVSNARSPHHDVHHLKKTSPFKRFCTAGAASHQQHIRSMLGHDKVAVFVLLDSQVLGDLLVHALVRSPRRKSLHAASSPFSEMHFASNDLDATVQCPCSMGCFSVQLESNPPKPTNGNR